MFGDFVRLKLQRRLRPDADLLSGIRRQSRSTAAALEAPSNRAAQPGPGPLQRHRNARRDEVRAQLKREAHESSVTGSSDVRACGAGLRWDFRGPRRPMSVPGRRESDALRQ